MIGGRKGFQAHSCKEFGQNISPFFQQEHLPELANVSKQQCPSLLQVNLQMGVPIRCMLKGTLQSRHGMTVKSFGIRSIGMTEGQLARHPEMEKKIVPVQTGNQKFSSPIQFVNFLAGKMFQQSRRLDLEDLAVGRREVHHGLTHGMRLESSSNGLNLG